MMPTAGISKLLFNDGSTSTGSSGPRSACLDHQTKGAMTVRPDHSFLRPVCGYKLSWSVANLLRRVPRDCQDLLSCFTGSPVTSHGHLEEPPCGFYNTSITSRLGHSRKMRHVHDHQVSFTRR